MPASTPGTSSRRSAPSVGRSDAARSRLRVPARGNEGARAGGTRTAPGLRSPIRGPWYGRAEESEARQAARTHPCFLARVMCLQERGRAPPGGFDVVQVHGPRLGDLHQVTLYELHRFRRAGYYRACGPCASPPACARPSRRRSSAGTQHPELAIQLFVNRRRPWTQSDRKTAQKSVELVPIRASTMFLNPASSTWSPPSPSPTAIGRSGRGELYTRTQVRREGNPLPGDSSATPGSPRLSTASASPRDRSKSQDGTR